MIFFLPRANDTCFLGSLRSLSIRNNQIISGLYKWEKEKIFYSDFSNKLTKKINLPNPARYEKEFLKKIILLGKKLKSKNKIKTFYIPTSDTNMMIAINNWKKISKYFFILGNKKFSKPQKKVYCKYTMFKFLKKNKIVTPKTLIYNVENCKKMLSKFGSFIIKPSIKDYSQSFYARNLYKAIYVKNQNDLNNFKKKNRFCKNKLLIQKKINFNKINNEIPIYIYADKNHKIQFSICGLKHFVYPKKYGTAGILGITKNQEVEKISQKIVKLLKWRGILMIEFIYDKNERKWNVIEMNGRPWLMIDFFRRLDFSFLKLLTHDFQNFNLKKIVKKFNLKKNQAFRTKPLHLDLSLLNESVKKESSNLKKIKNIIKKSKNITFSTLDEFDKRPFLKEKTFISKRLLKLFNI
tara:strand:+ start:2296 stop:3522 length:1227 start_codon:yes stop_codon:yes gene_type:complete